MPSPIGHSLIGMAIGTAVLLPRTAARDLGRALYRIRRPLLGCVILANLPDLDYLAGLFTGDLNRYHQVYTHTLGWIVLAALGVWLLGRYKGSRFSAGLLALGLCLLVSHLAADMVTHDGSEPYGIMALWPFGDARFISPVSLFRAFRKDHLTQVFDVRNTGAVLVEILWCGGLLAVVLLSRIRRRSGRAGRPGPPNRCGRR